MRIRDEDLDNDPVNCGNCQHMKTHKKEKDGILVMYVRCIHRNGITYGIYGWLLDGQPRALPKAWQHAKQCTSFISVAYMDFKVKRTRRHERTK